MKKALKVLAVVCAGVLVTLILLGITTFVLLFRPMQVDNIVVEIYSVTQEELDRAIARGIAERGEEHARAMFPSDDPEDYIHFIVRADLNNRTFRSHIDHVSTMGGRTVRTRHYTIEPFTRNQGVYIFTILHEHVGGLGDYMESTLRSMPFTISTSINLPVLGSGYRDASPTARFRFTTTIRHSLHDATLTYEGFFTEWPL